MNNKSLGKILLGMGLVTLITTLVDYYALIFPLNIKNPHWVFSITSGLSDISIMPALAIIFLLAGLYVIRDKHNESLLGKIEKGIGVFSLVFTVMFSVCALMYAISAGGVESNIVESLKAQNVGIKERLNKLTLDSSIEIDRQKLKQRIEKMDEQMMVKISQANTKIKKSLFKTMLTLIFFSLFHVYIFLRVFNLNLR